MKKILVLSFLILLNNFVFAEENPPKVTTQQFDNWTYQCVDNDKQKNCEVRQTLRIQNSNLSFSIVYSRFLNDEKNSKGLLTIIAPLGIDVNTQLALRFDGKDQTNLFWSTCEPVGCLVFLSDNSKDVKMIETYKTVYDSLIKSSTLEIAVKGYANNQPLAIKSDLKGFSAAAKKLNS